MTPVADVIGLLNRTLRGWKHYFSHGYPRVAFRSVNQVCAAAA